MPRALHSIGALHALITDSWSPASSPHAGAVLPRLAGRFEPALADARVAAGGARWWLIEGALRAGHALSSSGWPLIVARNRVFDRMASRQLRALAQGRPRVFAYSYACTRTLQVARELGCPTVMGQIDGGPEEERIVLEEIARYPELGERDRPAPREYWARWREQCECADRILVNSPWAMQCLQAAGIERTKMVTVPLFYEGPGSAGRRPPPPASFTSARPLRVLFLGQVNLRKGAARLFDAMRLLRAEPIELTLVGPRSVNVPADIGGARNLKCIGAVPRGEAGLQYRNADVFILPTLSDGFAITQLEARAHGLPVIASRHCGPVVRDGVDGLILPAVTGEAIADCLRGLVREPDRLARMQAQAGTAATDVREYARQFVEATCA